MEYNADTLHDIMNKMVAGLAGGKMSASDPNSKIDLLDTPDVSARKIKKANAPPKVVEENGLLAFVENVLLPASSLLDGERSFKVDREGAEPLMYGDIESLRKDYVDDVVCFLTPSEMIGLIVLTFAIAYPSIAQTRRQPRSPPSSRPYPE